MFFFSFLPYFFPNYLNWVELVNQNLELSDPVNQQQVGQKKQGGRSWCLGLGSSVVGLWCHQSHHGWGQASKAHMTNLESLSLNRTPRLMQSWWEAVWYHDNTMWMAWKQCAGGKCNKNWAYKVLINEGVKLLEDVLNIYILFWMLESMRRL